MAMPFSSPLSIYSDLDITPHEGSKYDIVLFVQSHMIGHPTLHTEGLGRVQIVVQYWFALL